MSLGDLWSADRAPEKPPAHRHRRPVIGPDIDDQPGIDVDHGSTTSRTVPRTSPDQPGRRLSGCPGMPSEGRGVSCPLSVQPTAHQSALRARAARIPRLCFSATGTEPSDHSSAWRRAADRPGGNVAVAAAAAVPAPLSGTRHPHSRPALPPLGESCDGLCWRRADPRRLGQAARQLAQGEQPGRANQDCGDLDIAPFPSLRPSPSARSLGGCRAAAAHRCRHP